MGNSHQQSLVSTELISPLSSHFLKGISQALKSRLSDTVHPPSLEANNQVIGCFVTQNVFKYMLLGILGVHEPSRPGPRL
jgi:hypothetical protein